MQERSNPRGARLEENEDDNFIHEETLTHSLNDSRQH